VTGGAGTGDAIVVANNGGATFTVALADSFAARISGVEKITAEASNQAISLTLNNNAFEYGVTTVDLSGDTTATGANIITVAAETNASNDFTITGSAGVDTITGGAGDDTIDAGAGNDVINTSSGADTITLGTGEDAIALVKAQGTGMDTVNGFVVGASGDTIRVDESELGVLVDGSGGTVTSSTTVSIEILTAAETATDDDVFFILDGNYATTAIVETALEVSGDRALTFSAAIAAGEEVLIAYDDGTDSYVAILEFTTSGGTTMTAGESTVSNLIKLDGVADATTITALDFSII
jgi:Ca2+-binding RTX toxin-like protein